jgi:hypothetical protein
MFVFAHIEGHFCGQNYFKIRRVHLKFSNEQYRVAKSEAVTEVLMKTGVFWDVTPCRILFVCACVRACVRARVCVCVCVCDHSYQRF